VREGRKQEAQRKGRSMIKGRFKDKVALVTGGSSGIGRASAIVFGKEGANVVIADLDVVGGEETVKMIKAAGGQAVFAKTEVTREAEVEQAIRKAIDTYGRLDCAFNNAGGGGKMASLTECTKENWDYIINVHLTGVWLCMKYEIPEMLKAGGGAIVNTASIYGLVGEDFGMPAYVAAKHGVVGLTREAAMEYAKANIRINAVCPGTTLTPSIAKFAAADPASEQKMIQLHPIGRLGEPFEIAEAAVWLCSDAASFVTGVALAVDGGYTAR
jgi:NAD(P)-dependent dehydrogenase (short-subunit alcohol dehydrogenase family)